MQRVVGEHAQGDHDVAEVGGDGAHGHPNLAGLQRRVGVGNRLQLQVLEGARAADRPNRHGPSAGGTNTPSTARLPCTRAV